ncbi:MAG: M48 family metalloprotease [Vicinamibacterales bacterium]|nr:M48 family metalloprotease [Vicinamibacterales bacterium]MDP6609125.1 M48 family metalloprotease [Vicinamibacterales bacterium]
MNEDKATRYHRLRRRATLTSRGISVLLLAAMLLTGASAALRDFVAGADGEVSLSGVALSTACLILCHELLILPVRVWLEYLERRYRPATSSPASPVDYLKVSGGLLAVGPLGASLLYAVIESWPTRWWLVMGSVFALIVVGVVTAVPAVMFRFFAPTPLARPELRDRLKRLAARAGAPDVEVHALDPRGLGKPANAAVVGVGDHRRVLLSDTLVAGYSDDEIEVVIAHELGHHLHGDLWKGLASDIATILVGCFAASHALLLLGPSVGLSGSSDPAGLPLVLLAGGAGVLVMAPVRNQLSRHHERRADRFALELTRNPEAFMSAMRRLGEEHLAERPSRWLAWLSYAHPPVHERIAAAGMMAEVWSGAVRTEPR